MAPGSPDQGCPPVDPPSTAPAGSTPTRAGGAAHSRSPTVPELVERLFATVKPAGGLGREYTHPEIAERAAAAGYSISPSHVWQLRHNGAKNPTIRALEAIAAAFGMPLAYFFVDDAPLREDLALLAALHDPAVRDLAIRAHGLSAETVAALATFADRAREWEGIGAPEYPPEPAGSDGAARDGAAQRGTGAG